MLSRPYGSLLKHLTPKHQSNVTLLVSYWGTRQLPHGSSLKPIFGGWPQSQRPILLRVPRCHIMAYQHINLQPLILWYLDLQDLGAVKLVRIELPAKVEVHLHFNAHHGVMMGYHQSFSPDIKKWKQRTAGQDNVSIARCWLLASSGSITRAVNKGCYHHGRIVANNGFNTGVHTFLDCFCPVTRRL